MQKSPLVTSATFSSPSSFAHREVRPRGTSARKPTRRRRTVTAFGRESAWMDRAGILLRLRLHQQLSAIGLHWVPRYAEASDDCGCRTCSREVIRMMKKVLTWAG